MLKQILSDDRSTGLFITLEGIEGVGKSSNLAFLVSHLQRSGLQVVQTREPGGTEIAERIRALLLDSANAGMQPLTEALLMFASRHEHVSSVIQPALARGNCVVSDRFVDASFAYQGGGRELGSETIDVLARLVLGDLQPDLVLLLDLEPVAALARLASRNGRDRIEQEKIEFFEAARQAYLARAQAEPDRFAIIDASVPVAAVQAQIEQALSQFLVPATP